MRRLRDLLAFLLLLLAPLAGGCATASAPRPTTPAAAARTITIALRAWRSGALLGPVPTVAPMITGTPAEGSTLTATLGTWSGSPVSYTIQWERCNDKPDTCTVIPGASETTHTLTSEDVGYTLRVVVTAHALSGIRSAASSETMSIEHEHPEKAHCLGHEEECGFPGPNDSGVPASVTLTPLVPAGGNLVLKTPGEKIEDKRIEGTVEIRNSGVEMIDDEIIAESQKAKCEKNEGPGVGGGALQIKGHGTGEKEIDTGVKVEYTTVRGVTQGCPESLNIGIADRLFGPGTGAEAANLEHDKIYQTGGCMWGGAKWEWDYCLDNTEILGEHYDGLYTGGGNTPNIIRHNTIIVPHIGAGPIACFNEGGEEGRVVIEDNLLAGGGFTANLCYKHAAEPPKYFPAPGPIIFVANRVARCLGKSLPGNNGSHYCEGLAQETEPHVVEPDAFGYFPLFGAFGLTNDVAPGTIFSGNRADNNLEHIL